MDSQVRRRQKMMSQVKNPWTSVCGDGRWGTCKELSSLDPCDPLKLGAERDDMEVSA